MISICLSIMSCQTEKCNCEIEDKLIAQNDSLINSIINQSENKFENYWDRFEEPILNKEEVESYRFSIVVLLYDFFKVYRVEKKENKFKLHVKEYAVSTTTKYREDSLVNSFTKEITEHQWKEITGEFERNCFWTMPVDIKEDDGYLDGSGWVLEAKSEGNNCTISNYHLAHRNSPNDTTKFSKICDKFFELDSLNLRRF